MSPKLQPTDSPTPPSQPAALAGLQAAFHWMTVLPLPAPRIVDRHTGRWSITMLPVVGIVYGLAGGALVGLTTALGLPGYLTALSYVGLLILISRGLHVDGLADTIDGLGSYRPAPAALDIMRSGPVGPMGATALILQILTLTGVFTAATDAGWWWVLALAPVCGRLGVLTACLRPFHPTNPDGFGGMMIGTQTPLRLGLWALGITAGLLGAAALNLLSWPMVLSSVCGLLAAVSFSALWAGHLQRRFGGLNGDMLGAVSELATLIAAATMLISAASTLT